MIKLKELLKNYEKIRILVKKDEYYEFLQWAKENDCLWSNGRIIHPGKDEYDHNVIGVTKDLLIHHVYGYIANMMYDFKPGYRFADLKRDVISNVNIEKEIEREKTLQLNMTVREAKEYMFKERCKQNRKASQLQLKYRQITNKLPTQFNIKYKDSEELLKLYLLLQKYGYENYYNIDFSLFDDKPYALCVDNQNMIYTHMNISDCTDAISDGQKFYEYEAFEKMMNRIFDEVR